MTATAAPHSGPVSGPDSGPDPDLSLLIDAALEAGRIATPFWQGAHKVWDKGGGAGPVTEADLAVDAMLLNRLQAARPDYGWLSEETDDTRARRTERDRAARTFVIDPIDGTRAFTAGERTWSHSLAVVDGDGVPLAGVVYLPVRDKLYAASRGGGATLNGAPIRASEQSALGGALMLAARPAMEPRHWRDGIAPPVRRTFRTSLAYRLALVGEGKVDAMLTLRDSWDWDIAAGTLIAQEAGGRVTDRHGAPLRFNSPARQVRGTLAAGPHLHAPLLHALHP